MEGLTRRRLAPIQLNPATYRAPPASFSHGSGRRNNLQLANHGAHRRRLLCWSRRRPAITADMTPSGAERGSTGDLLHQELLLLANCDLKYPARFNS